MKVALEGKTALVIGAHGDISDALAQALVASGATVARAYATARFAAGDAKLYGAPYVVVNVSVGAQTGPTGDENVASESEFERFAFAARVFAPSAKRVIHVISAAGVVPVRGAANFSARQASLVSLTRVLAMELAPATLVNALAVGALAGDAPAAARFVSHVPLKRAATSAEIGFAALFLADPLNSYTTGHVMTVDGGWSVGYARNF
jgi:NAD(P)-dependent dehydrogenase (short-subunit alcohol dehydrogenase family)